MVVYTFFFLQSLVHRTYVSLISLVSFWIFVLVDMSTYLSPILTIMPPRIEESVCGEKIVSIRDNFSTADLICTTKRQIYLKEKKMEKVSN